MAHGNELTAFMISKDYKEADGNVVWLDRARRVTGGHVYWRTNHTQQRASALSKTPLQKVLRVILSLRAPFYAPPPCRLISWIIIQMLFPRRFSRTEPSWCFLF